MGPSSEPRPSRVLVVEDERDLARMVAAYLERAGHVVHVTHDGREAVARARSLDPDVIVLDLGLPGLDGVEVCRQVRTFSDCYVLMLTARADEVDLLVGLSVGADDYLVKPLSPRQLVARVQVVLRRPRTTGAAADDGGGERVFGDLVVDVEARRVSVAGERVELTRTEFDLLTTMLAAPRRVWSRAVLLDTLWGAGWSSEEHLVEVHVGNLRRKLTRAAPEGTRPLIRTVRGVGYRMEEPDAQ
jgi:DNA-binding response OmpR family regulator